MTELDEKRCRDLMLKLARGCGWHVRVWTPEKDGFVHKQVSSKTGF